MTPSNRVCVITPVLEKVVRVPRPDLRVKMLPITCAPLVSTGRDSLR